MPPAPRGPRQHTPMLTLAQAAFSALDWAILIGYFIILALTGWLFARREPSGAKEYFLAGRQMPMWAVAISVLATSTSAATFLGAPEQAFTSDFSYLSSNIGSLIAVFIVAIFFIPAFYRNNCTTVYDVIGIRYGPGARQATSWAFMIGRVFASGSRLYMSAIPLALILFGDADPSKPASALYTIIAIAILTIVGILYTLVGGIRSIIWTDVIQTVVFVGAACAAAIILLLKMPIGVADIWNALGSTPVTNAAGEVSGTKLTVIKFDTNPAVEFTIFTAFIGFTLQGVAAYGTDHDLAQRMLTCKTAAQGSRSVITAILIGLPVTALFMVIGAMLWVFYKRPDLMGAAAPSTELAQGRQAFLQFIIHQMPRGMPGLMMAGLFAAGLGSFLSALNAMSAAFVNDVYQRARPGRTDRHYLFVGRWAVAGWGLILGCFAILCIYWQRGSGQNLIVFALGVMTFAYAGMLAVFFGALFTRRGNQRSAIAALIVGFLAVAAMDPGVHKLIIYMFPAARDQLSRVNIAFPWRLTIAAVIATLTCLLGSQSKAQQAQSALA